MTDITQNNQLSLSLKKRLEKSIKKTTGPKNQHYVTQSYQKIFFGEDRKIAIFDKKYNKHSRRGSERIASTNNLYVFVDDDGVSRYDIEYLIGSFETDAIPIIKKLSIKKTITSEECSLLSWFIAINILRTPSALDELLQAYKLFAKTMKNELFIDEKSAQIYFETQQGYTPKRALEHASYIFGKSKLTSGLQPALNLFLHLLPYFYNTICNSQWCLIESLSKKDDFIISDNGLSCFPQNIESWNNFNAPDMQRAFPLSPQVCLISTGLTGDGTIQHKYIDNEKTIQLNEALTWLATRYVMGGNTNQLQLLAEQLSQKTLDWKPIFSI